jgi:hypothetical protein
LNIDRLRVPRLNEAQENTTSLRSIDEHDPDPQRRTVWDRASGKTERWLLTLEQL